MRKMAFVFVFALARPVSANALNWPIQGRISSVFGPRALSFHTGIDIAAPIGDRIYSVRGGIVKFSGTLSGYGKTIIIWHKGFYSLYAHCSRIFFKANDKILERSLIGLIGISGNARGAHLHFEIRNHAFLPVDPLIFLNENIFTPIPQIIANGGTNAKKYSTK